MVKEPVFILITLWAIRLLLAAYLHGKEKEGTYNFFLNVWGLAINIGLLAWAGLFN